VRGYRRFVKMSGAEFGGNAYSGDVAVDEAGEPCGGRACRVPQRIYLTSYIHGASLSQGVRVSSIRIADAGGVLAAECFEVGAQDRLRTQSFGGCLGHPMFIETADGRRYKPFLLSFTGEGCLRNGITRHAKNTIARKSTTMLEDYCTQSLSVRDGVLRFKIMGGGIHPPMLLGDNSRVA
jgi:hypothetical protein